MMIQIRLLLYAACLVVLSALLHVAHAQIVVENAKLTWKAGMAATEFPVIPSRITLEYGSLIYENDLAISDELMLEMEKLGPRIVVEYASGIGHFALAAPHRCNCDFNHDGKCNIQDWPAFIEDWGRNDCLTPGVNCECDLNHDGKCNIQDWPLFIQDWGNSKCLILQ
jgi:hypothetical protein